MEQINKRPGESIYLGRQGEHLARQILFDLRDWEAVYGSGVSVELIYQRPRDASPYPVPLEREGSTAVWTVTATDTAKSGGGRAELCCYAGETLAKSAICIVNISEAMGEPDVLPDPPGQSWLDQALAAGAQAQQAAQRAEEAAKNAEEGAAGKAGEDGGYYTPEVTQPTANTLRISYTASKTDMEDVKYKDVTLPAGPKGEKGDKGDTGDTGATGPAGAAGAKGADGQDGYTPVRGTDYWTQADKDEIKSYVDEAILGGAW